MKIAINQIPQEGLILTEELNPAALDLDTEIIRFRTPVKATAKISRITNAVTVHLNLKAGLHTQCSRCLEEFDIDFNKDADFNLSLDMFSREIDLDPQIREEMILDYPLKPLCKEDCKGLCPKCGNNLNEGGCSCGST